MTNIEYAICRTCKGEVSIDVIKGIYIREDGTFGMCKACQWIKAHGIPDINGFAENEIKEALHFAFNTGKNHINDLAKTLNRSVDDCIRLFSTLRITTGRKKFYVSTSCDYCGKIFDMRLYEYRTHKNHYCSPECYWANKSSTMPKGEDSQFYNRITTHCTNCGKEIHIIPYRYSLKNRFNDNHNFCCIECYWEYRGKYYIKEKSANWQRNLTDEVHERLARAAIMNALKAHTRDTKIQRKVNNILDKNSIKYEREHFLYWTQIDNYLVDYNLMIEVQGDYWHCNPLIYNKDRLINDTQVRDIINDKRKHTYAKNLGINILYLWESDINRNPEVCEKLVLKYIENNGELENYNSFNWEIMNNEIVLKANRIYAYQELPFSETKKITKDKAS